MFDILCKNKVLKNPASKLSFGMFGAVVLQKKSENVMTGFYHA